MTITSTNFTDIGYVAETVPGQTPATPTFQLLPTTGGAPENTITTAVSEVIRSDRMIDDLVPVDGDVAGTLNYELSYAPYKPLIENFLRGTKKTVSFSGQIVAVNATSEFTTTDDFTSGTNLAVGDIIYMDDFVTNPENNQSYRITSLTATNMGVEPAPPVDETVASGTIDGEIIYNGANAIDYYTFVKRVQGIAATAYFYYPQMSVSGLSMNFETGSILNGTMEVIGTIENATETGIAGQTFNAIPAYDIMNSVTSVDQITIEGLSAASQFMSMNLSLMNNTTAAKAIGTLGAVDLADFTFEGTADVSLYFEDLIAYEKFKDSESFSVTIVLADVTGNRIQIYLPKCKFETLNPPIEGKDNFLMQEGSMRVLRDATLDYMVQFSFYTAP